MVCMVHVKVHFLFGLSNDAYCEDVHQRFVNKVILFGILQFVVINRFMTIG